MPKRKLKAPSRGVSIEPDVSASANKPNVIAPDHHGHRLLVAIGNQRFALDWKIQIARLDPVTVDTPAPVLRLLV